MARPLHPWIAALLVTALAAGCATSVPPSIRSAEDGGPTVGEARESGGRLEGTRVRWGGRILAVHNGPEDTLLEVLALPLSRGGEPQRDKGSRGRFLARVQGFLDPAVYAPDRRLTVYGVLSGLETRPVGDYPYVYPVVEVVDRYLWEEPGPEAARDPWCDPWDPFYGYPYPYSWSRPWPHCWW
ncbi:MAG: Slp/YeaY family lipoprotein [Chromatiales bacterium]|jgi:outer membrane lipoprotein